MTKSTITSFRNHPTNPIEFPNQLDPRVVLEVTDVVRTGVVDVTGVGVGVVAGDVPTGVADAVGLGFPQTFIVINTSNTDTTTNTDSSMI